MCAITGISTGIGNATSVISSIGTTRLANGGRSAAHWVELITSPPPGPTEKKIGTQKKNKTALFFFLPRGGRVRKKNKKPEKKIKSQKKNNMREKKMKSRKNK
jgi:hypothetical protein